MFFSCDHGNDCTGYVTTESLLLSYYFNWHQRGTEVISSSGLSGLHRQNVSSISPFCTLGYCSQQAGLRPFSSVCIVFLTAGRKEPSYSSLCCFFTATSQLSVASFLCFDMMGENICILLILPLSFTSAKNRNDKGRGGPVSLCHGPHVGPWQCSLCWRGVIYYAPAAPERRTAMWHLEGGPLLAARPGWFGPWSGTDSDSE